MIKVALKEKLGKAEVVGNISLLNDGVQQKFWRVTSEDGIVTFVPDEIFVEQYTVFDSDNPDNETLKKENENLKQDLSMKNEMLRNLQVEYLNALTKCEYVEKNYSNLLNLSKETFLSIKKDISEINERTKEEYSALGKTIENIIKSIA